MKKTTLEKIEGIVVLTSLFLSFLLIGQACATSIQFHYKIVDKELQPYVTEYQNLLKRYCTSGKYQHSSHYVIELKDELNKPEELGVCTRMMNGFHIGIRKDFWDSIDVEDRRQLMYHELAHCIIDREHDKNKHHYMYWEYHSIPPKDLNLQVTQDMVDHCTR